MTRFSYAVLAATLLAGLPAAAQNTVPEIAFDSAADPLALPDNIYLGETAGVATNSRGDIFVYTRTGHPTVSLGGARAFAHGGSRLFQFDRTGHFVREIGANSYGFMFAQQVRIDPQDNIWVVDQMTNMVIVFDPNGQIKTMLGRKAEAIPIPAPRAPAAGQPTAQPAAGSPPPGTGRPTDVFDRPTDVAWDAAGNIYVSDGVGNARVAKFDPHGVFIKSWGSKGSEPGKFGSARAIAVDAQGTVYVADSGNKRIEVFDSDGNFKTQYTNVGTPQALCITPGPNQILYSSNSNPPNDIDVAGEIYKMKLDGTVIGKFGKAGKLPKEFGFVNAIDCRSENTLYVGEIGNMRVQKITLH